MNYVVVLGSQIPGHGSGPFAAIEGIDLMIDPLSVMVTVAGAPIVWYRITSPVYACLLISRLTRGLSCRADPAHLGNIPRTLDVSHCRWCIHRVV